MDKSVDKSVDKLWISRTTKRKETKEKPVRIFIIIKNIKKNTCVRARKTTC